ncbi:MAG: acetate--CoA ligase family protein [Candidatus Ratteibacteria bacterium]
MFKKFFSPESIALIGASREPHKLGYRILENLILGGFKGNLYPVNPKANEVLDLPCYKNVSSLPKTPDLAVIVVPAKLALDAVEECGKQGTKAAVIITAGFKESNAEGKEREEKLYTISQKYGIRIIGPNCLGITDTYQNLNASFAPYMPHKGPIAFISQSGAIISAVLDWAKNEKLGFSRIISLGNMVDVSESEVIEDCASDPHTKVILLYMEGVKDGRDFISRVSKVARKKPIIALKAGMTAAGSRAVSSHTGSLAGMSQAYQAAFKKSGVLQVETMEELFDISMLFACQPILQGNRIAIVTNAGGPSVLATDMIEKEGLVAAELLKKTEKNLAAGLPPAANIHNPVDVLGDASEKEYGFAVETVAQDPGVDGIIAILTPQVVTPVNETAREIGKAAKQKGKTVMASFMGGASLMQAYDLLREEKIPNYPFPERGIRAFRAMVDFSNLSTAEKPSSKAFPVKKALAQAAIEKVEKSGRNILTDFEAREVFEAYGFRAPRRTLAKSAEEAIAAAESIYYPVVAKIASPDILHKTEAGGVQVGISNASEMKKAFEKIVSSAKAYKKNAIIEGVEVQEMVTGIQETIIGVKKDPQFGHLLMFGLGGIFVELLGDVTFRIVPIGAKEAEGMLNDIKGAKLLQGYRKTPAADTEALTEAILRVSQLCMDFPSIEELDLNPLIVKKRGKGLVMVDARIILAEK